MKPRTPEMMRLDRLQQSLQAISCQFVWDDPIVDVLERAVSILRDRYWTIREAQRTTESPDTNGAVV